jgi:hypothetical protein
MPTVPRIAVLNASTVLTDSMVAAAVLAIQHQISYDFGPRWHQSAKLTAYPVGSTPPATSWLLGIFDDSDQAGALGYHDVTAAGLPLGKVFAKTDIDYGYSWTVTASHETLEMIVDPDICRTAVDPTSTKVYALEVADACEADQFADVYNGVQLSDFVLPAWFSGAPGPYDFGKHITRPFGLLAGGYIGEMSSSGAWHQILADADPGAPPRGSRRERRARGRKDWKVSVR